MKIKNSAVMLDDKFYGGSLLGGIEISYGELVDIFGKPNQKNGDYKTDAEWLFFTPHGHVTMYNYKDGKNYLGKEGLNLTDITDWHIGGESKRAYEHLIEVIRKYR